MNRILPPYDLESPNAVRPQRPSQNYSTKRITGLKPAIAFTLAMILPAWAQYPGHMEANKKPAATMRSIAVLEWTGEKEKPSASRIIPVAVFDGESYQPGGLYLAKPQPLAVEPGTEYILQDAGITRGFFDVNTAQDVDGYWFGYGKWKTATPPPPKPKSKPGRLKPQVVGEENDGRPHFKGKQPGQDDSSSSTSSDTKSGSGSSGASTSHPPPAADPDRPTLRHRSDSGDNNAATDTSSATSTSAPATPPETATAGGDPDRPHMAHGQVSSTTDTEVPQLTGVPLGIQQMIAVSDASDHETHPFVYLWNDPADSLKMQEQLKVAAVEALAAAAPQPKPATKPKTGTKSATTHTAAAPHRKTTPPATAAAPVLTNEHFKAYELTYSGGATLVYSAESTDKAGKTKYVTLIAQPDFNGTAKVLFKSVTDDDHLDQTPKMRLVDAVDAKASNRGDLVFELRRSHDREFVIYRISAGYAEQVFTTGSLANQVSPS